MQSENQQSSYQLLWKTFTEAFGGFFKGVGLYLNTSIAVISTNPEKLAAQVEQGNGLSDTKYVYRIFEYILIFLFLSKLLQFGADLEEYMEVVQDFFVLILYFAALLVVIALGRFFRILFFKQISKRKVESHFLYAFGFLFFPCYLMLYFGLDLLDEAGLDGLANLLVFGTTLFLWLYYFRMAKFFNTSAVKSLFFSMIMAIVMAVFLILSLSLVAGAGYLEA